MRWAPDSAVVVLRNPARGREWLGASAFLPLTVVNLVNLRIPEWVRIALFLIFLALFALHGLAALSRIVVYPAGVDIRTARGRRHRLNWTAVDHFAARGRYRVDVHLTTGRRIAVMRFAPVEDENPASTVALLEYERRRHGGAVPAESAAGPTD